MFRISDTVKHLIIINVIVLVGAFTVGKYGLFNDLFAMHFPKHTIFKPWQLLTYMFMHSDFNHLLSNMFLLFIFGTGLEFGIGKTKFLFIYISAGLGAIFLDLAVNFVEFYMLYSDIAYLNMSSELFNSIFSINARDGNMITGELLAEQMEPLLLVDNFDLNLISGDVFETFFNLNVLGTKTMLGASGAVMGILAGFGFLFPNQELTLLFLPISIKVKYIIVGMIGADFISAFLTGTLLLANSNIGYVAHVGGALTGFLITWYWKKKQFNKYRRD